MPSDLGVIFFSHPAGANVACVQVHLSTHYFRPGPTRPPTESCAFLCGFLSVSFNWRSVPFGSLLLLSSLSRGHRGSIVLAAGLYVDHMGKQHNLCPQHSTSNKREVERVLSMGGTIVNNRVSVEPTAGRWGEGRREGAGRDRGRVDRVFQVPGLPSELTFCFGGGRSKVGTLLQGAWCILAATVVLSCCLFSSACQRLSCIPLVALPTTRRCFSSMIPFLAVYRATSSRYSFGFCFSRNAVRGTNAIPTGCGVPDADSDDRRPRLQAGAGGDRVASPGAQARGDLRAARRRCVVSNLESLWCCRCK